jgi:hypothetical protein
MVTKQDFQAIADILAGSFATATASEKGAIWCLTLSLADYFGRANPRFDRARFYEAVLGNSDHFAVRDSFAHSK